MRLVVLIAFGLGALAAAACDARPSERGTPQAAALAGELNEPAAKPAVVRLTLAESSADAPAAMERPRSVLSPITISARPARPAPIVVPNCRLEVVEKEEVPSQRDGVLLVVCTEIRPGELPAADRLIEINVNGQRRRYRRLREGDAVGAGQLVALLDDRLARDTCVLKERQVLVSRAELEAAEKSEQEGKERYLRQVKLHSAAGGVATSDEELSGSEAVWYKAHYEAVGRKEALALAEVELHQAQTVLATYEIRASISGVIQTIAKNPGEAVKSLEPLLEIRNPRRLRVEGMADMQERWRLRPGLKVTVQAPEIVGARQRFEGHLGEVTGVAVAGTRHGLVVVSASEDGTVRVWDRDTARVRRLLRHPAPVRALACSPPGAPGCYCVAACADGSAWLWDLDSSDESPAHELNGHSHAALTCAACSSDGKSFATGGDDHQIWVWDASNGSLRYRCPQGHLAAVTWLRFCGSGKLLSAGRDETLRVWALADGAATLEKTFEHRAGDVAQLDASADGRLALFDQANALHILDLQAGASDAVLRSPRGSPGFKSFARFSNNGKLVLTTEGSDGRLRLWRLHGADGRPAEVRQLIPPEPAAATCAAFAPDGSFLVTGTRDHQVLVWTLPAGSDNEHPYTGELTLVEQALESSARQVRVWAELANADGRLIPGTTVTLEIHPED